MLAGGVCGCVCVGGGGWGCVRSVRWRRGLVVPDTAMEDSVLDDIYCTEISILQVSQCGRVCVCVCVCV